MSFVHVSKRDYRAQERPLFFALVIQGCWSGFSLCNCSLFHNAIKRNEPIGYIYSSVLRPVFLSSRKDEPVALFKTHRRSGRMYQALCKRRR